MSFWQRLFGAARTPVAPLVFEFELIPGQLTARVTRHDLPAGGGVIPCWTYSTSGLAAAGQREIVLSLRVLPDEATAPRDPLPLFTQLFRLAGQGRTVDEGDYTCFRAPGGFLGTTEQTGLAYIAAVTLPGVEVPARALAAILLTPEEAEIVPVIGAYRVTALLGRDARYFPCPPWSERGRPSVLTRDDMEGSVLRKMPLAVYPGASARLDMLPLLLADGLASTAGACLTLSLPLPLPPGFRDTVAQLPDEWTLALLTRPDAACDGRLVWRPGQDLPETITREGGGHTAATGGFVVLGAGGTMPTGAKLLEDGFALMLSPPAAAAVRKALVDAAPLKLDGEGGLFSFGLSWAPEEAPPRTQAAFEVVRTILYQPEEVMRSRVPSVEALSRYLREVMEASESYWAGVEAGEGRPVLLTLALRPGGLVRFWVDAEPALEPMLAWPWVEKLEALPVPPTRDGPVALSLEATLWRRPCTPGQWPYMPAVWQAACANQALLVPDGVLDVVWPG